MNGVVIYKSKYGATHQYASWIGRELQLPVFETGEMDAEKLNKYDFAIIGSSVYMGKMLIKKWLKDNLEILWHKKIFLFVVSGTLGNKKDKLEGFVTASVPEEIRNRSEIHFFPGKLIVKELSLFDRLILKAAAKMGERKEGTKKSLKDYNFIDRKNVTELVNSVKNSSQLHYTAIITSPGAAIPVYRN
jgi:menaquinone-dependent protoporphyrinogen IX oxidase